jgi:hypothetical protein
MGGAFSKSQDSSNPVSSDNLPLYKKIDYIASDYILSSDFKSLERLKEKDYCNKIVVITSDILEKYLGTTDILYLQQKMKKGHEDPVNIMAKNSVAFVKSDDLNNLGVVNAVKKKRLCIGIAKKYVRVAHIFASIVTAINPVYTYKDESGNIVRTPLYKKDEIPPNIKVTLENFNICENRIKTLQGAQKDAFGAEGSPIIVSPTMCQAAMKLDGTEKTLVDEPGIPELMQLYYDKYDYSTGEFVGMTERTKKVYEEHVKIFNNTFTGTDSAEIKEFADIKLKNYNKNAYCEGNAITSQKQYSSEHVSKEQYELFTKYAEQVKTMIANANKNQATLLQIINELFTPVPDPLNPKKTHYKVNSKLDDNGLEKLVRRTRELIMKLFLTCESDYAIGIKLYEAIVNSVIIDITNSQIKNLEEVKENIIAEPTIIDSVVDSLNPFSTNEKEEEEEKVIEPILGPSKTLEQIEEEELNINEKSIDKDDAPAEIASVDSDKITSSVDITPENTPVPEEVTSLEDTPLSEEAKAQDESLVSETPVPEEEVKSPEDARESEDIPPPLVDASAPLDETHKSEDIPPPLVDASASLDETHESEDIPPPLVDASAPLDETTNLKEESNELEEEKKENLENLEKAPI